MPTERKYALTKVAPGDYVLPSNDGQTIWRIARYTDGPSHGITDWPRDQDFWGVWRWSPPYPSDHIDVEDWNLWGMHEGSLPTRAAAIASALDA